MRVLHLADASGASVGPLLDPLVKPTTSLFGDELPNQRRAQLRELLAQPADLDACPAVIRCEFGGFAAL